MKHLRQLAFSFGLILAVVAGAAGYARADTGESITSFSSDIVLNQAGEAHVTETIVYDFGALSKHGIYRVIPVKYQGAKNDHYVLKISGISIVDADGQPWTYDDSQANGIDTLKIGSANTLVTGRQTYKLNYTLSPIVTEETNLDNFRFNVTGNGWNVPINKATATLTSPTGISPTKWICYTGATGSKDQNCTTTEAGGQLVMTTNGVLSAGEGLTIGADYPRGSFASYVTPVQLTFLERYQTILIAGYALIMLLLLSWPFVGWWQQWRAKRQLVVIAEYEAPDGLSPGELGTLLDDKASMVEITATLIDLAVRGYIKIEQIAKGGMLSGANYRFTKLKEGTDLAPLELELFTILFAGGLIVELKSLNRTAMAATTKAIQTGFKSQLETRGFYAKRSIPWLWIGIMAVFSLPLLFFGRFPLFIVLAIIFAVVTRKTLTEAGKAEWAKVAGFKLFLSVTETDRLKFSDAPERTPEQFSKLLPAAVALGVEKEWAKQFEGMDIMPATGWYVGNAPFTAVLLANDLGGGFNTAVSSGFAPVSSGSGFSSGGGMSGGGFGGGGGGSW